jgi:hypothetical protein
MAKNVGRLAGLAALGAAAYMMSKGKDAKGPSATADEEKSSKARTAAQKDAVSGDRAAKDENYSNEGYKKPEIKNEPKSAPVDKREVKPVDLPPQANQEDKKDAPASTVSSSEAGMENYKPRRTPKASTTSSSEAGMKNYKPRRTPKASTTSSSEVGMKNYKPRRTPPVVSQIPGQSRSGPTGGERVSGTELSRNLSNTAVALSPLTGGASKVAAEFAMGRNAAKAATAEKLSPAGQRLKNMEEVRNVAMPGRREAVMNPLAHAGGPKMMDKVAQAEARAAAAEARAAAAQAKRDAKDPFMNFKPGSDFKRGGAVKMTASSRADGIATRGKTKCKMY